MQKGESDPLSGVLDGCEVQCGAGTEQRTPAIATAALHSRAISHPSSPQNSFNNCFPSQIQVISAFKIFCMCVSVHAYTCALACLSVYHVFAGVHREQREC